MTAQRIGIAGTGSHMPATVVSNDDIARMINRGDKDAEWAFRKLGIRERRFMTPLDPSSGKPTQAAEELDMAENAARLAILNAGMKAEEIDGLYFVSCTATTQKSDLAHFNTAAYELQNRLGLRNDVEVMQMDAGCGGALHAMVHSVKMISGNGMDNMVVVASNAPSRYYGNWPAYVTNDEWLPMYIFGDGAGATLLRKSSSILSASEMIAYYTASDPKNPLMFYKPMGNNPEPLYIIDGRAVAAGFGIYAKAALEGLQKKQPFDYNKVDRFYFHQVNGRVLEKFVDKMGIPREKVAMHVDKYGNIAAAATLVLLDEDRRHGRVSEGDLCVFCTVGAGAQYGAALIQL